MDTTPYGSNVLANQFVRLSFPRYVYANALSESVRYNNPRDFTTLMQVLSFNNKATNDSEVGPKIIDLHHIPIESYWLYAQSDDDARQAFVDYAPIDEITQVARNITSAPSSFHSVLEQALFQRDVYQLLWITSTVLNKDLPPEGRERCHQMHVALTSLWQHLLLSKSQLRELLDSKPTMVKGSFSTLTHFDLTENYLPTQVLSKDTTWYSFPDNCAGVLHALMYAGRSFMHTSIRMPGKSAHDVEAFWDATNEGAGDHSSFMSKVLPVPAGTETMLVRTFAVFLEDGSVVDSEYPEEVVLRIFSKESGTNVQPGTSDYRGTLFYQYKMDRAALLQGKSLFGLIRRLDNEPSFGGFYADAPGSMSYGGGLTTMQTNCIQCHSEASYGTRTIFSLAIARQHPPSTWTKLFNVKSDGRIELVTEEHKQIMRSAHLCY